MSFTLAKFGKPSLSFKSNLPGETSRLASMTVKTASGRGSLAGLPVTLIKYVPAETFPTTKKPCAVTLGLLSSTIQVGPIVGYPCIMFPSVGDMGLREIPQEVSPSGGGGKTGEGDNPAAVKVISLPIPLPAELSESATMNVTGGAQSGGLPGELPHTAIAYGPAVTYAIKKLPLRLQRGVQLVTVQVALAPTGAPETVQAVSEPENPEPEKLARDPAPPHGTCTSTKIGGLPCSSSTGQVGPVNAMVWALILGRSEVAVEISNTSTIRILLAVLRVEP